VVNVRVVAVHLDGNFPGVADLQWRFAIRDGAIVDLTID
jgi:hypothetical protein